jgi:hypothetical protein
MLTYEQALKNEALKNGVNSHLKDRNFLAFLGAIQNRAMPNAARPLAVPHMPGAHPDSITTQDTRFWQGWSACIEAILNFPTGKPPEPFTDDEELFAYDPAVQEIDKELKAKKGTA